ncbi:MAG: hypothetical protein JWN56_153 [Sphingobacteriales bacterium]|nr:hypothetical protein [Sphingobacteriales bacterium]
MDEYLLNVLNESTRVISKLQILSNYFEDDVVYKIYLRTQVIHDLFETNPEISASKLELFHLQFTQSVIDLLKRIKKNNEKNVSLVYDEIQLNNDLIDKMNESVYTEKHFNLDKQRQTLKINTSLRRLYQVLSDDSTDFPFSKNILSFSSRYAKDFFYEVSPELFDELVTYSHEEVYTNTYALIEKKLLGKLCKYDFKTDFYCGLKAGNVIVEVYKFQNTDSYFLFLPSRNLFLFFDPVKISELDLETTISKKSTIIQELRYKSDRLESSILGLKTYIPPDIRALLQESYHKISDISFLDTISNADVQANVLKTMLRTDMM